MQPLTFTNSQSALHDSFVRDMAEWISVYTQIPTEFVTAGTWDNREAGLDAGKIDLGWICGAPYVMKKERGVPLSVIGAPVMAHPRYLERPIYYSDVIVRAESPFQSFEDLRGTRWVYNEPHSHSGYHVVRHYLAARHRNGDFFGQVRASGAHQTSVELVLRGEADASAIDSTVLEMLIARDPALAQQLRIIATLGHSPMPPFVIGNHVPTGINIQFRAALAQMHETIEGRTILARAQMSRIALVDDTDYDPIREMLVQASAVRL